MKVFFSHTEIAFYPQSIYPSAADMPGVVLLSDSEVSSFVGVSAPAGKKLGSYNLRPCWIDQGKKIEDPMKMRRLAYRNESDPLKIEAEYDALISGSDPDYGPWKEAVKSIKDRFPLPTAAK